MEHNKIKHISNRNELITYLSQEGNSYSNFILEKINRDPPQNSKPVGLIISIILFLVT